MFQAYYSNMSFHYTISMVLAILLAILDGSQTAYTVPAENSTAYAVPVENFDFAKAADTVAAENFDPAEADPTGNITCLGDSYDLELPTQAHWNPNTVSMQSLCAKTHYGVDRLGRTLQAGVKAHLEFAGILVTLILAPLRSMPVPALKQMLNCKTHGSC